MANNVNGFIDIWNASTDALKKSLGIFTGGSAQELQAVSIGSQEAVTKGIDNLKIAGICFAIGGVALLGLIGYNKLRELRVI